MSRPRHKPEAALPSARRPHFRWSRRPHFRWCWSRRPHLRWSRRPHLRCSRRRRFCWSRRPHFRWSLVPETALLLVSETALPLVSETALPLALLTTPASKRRAVERYNKQKMKEKKTTMSTGIYLSMCLLARSCLARCVKTNFPKTGGGEKLRIFSENRGRPVALSQKTEGGPSRVECDLARLLRFEWRYLVAEIQPIDRVWLGLEMERQFPKKDVWPIFRLLSNVSVSIISDHSRPSLTHGS
jgi:hypothetical protein